MNELLQCRGFYAGCVVVVVVVVGVHVVTVSGYKVLLTPRFARIIQDRARSTVKKVKLGYIIVRSKA